MNLLHSLHPCERERERERESRVLFLFHDHTRERIQIGPLFFVGGAPSALSHFETRLPCDRRAPVAPRRR